MLPGDVQSDEQAHWVTQVNAPRIFLLFFLPVLVFWFVNLIMPMVFINFDMNNLRVSVGKAYSKDNLARTGTFGDTFGAVNSLFSGLAFAGVAVAVVFQWRELRHLEEQMAIAKQQLSVADRQSKEAEHERKRAERYASLTACLNAAMSLTEAYSQSIEFTMTYSEQSNPIREAKEVRTKRSRNVMAEKMFSKYRQIQHMIFFEIQNFDAFYSEHRDILSLKIKKEYFGYFIRTILPEWRRLLTEKLDLQKTGGQGFSPDDHFTPNDWIMTQVAQQLRIVWHEVVTFLSQEGVGEAIFAPMMSATLKEMETLLAELQVIDDNNDEAVRTFFAKGYSILARFDISSFQV